MYAHILKGAPFGNKNAAGPHKGGGGKSKPYTAMSVSRDMTYVPVRAAANESLRFEYKHKDSVIGSVSKQHDGSWYSNHYKSGTVGFDRKTHDAAAADLAGAHARLLNGKSPV